MSNRLLAILALLLLLSGTVPAQASTSPWSDIDTGMQIALFAPPQTPDEPTILVALRIDPNLWNFSLHCATDRDGRALSLGAWAEQFGLTAAINASMYLPDARSSTAYLRSGGHINNPRIASKFGSFFVAGPKDPTLPNADLLDRTVDAWAERLDRYDMVVQNYRLISTNRRILWPQGGPVYSIAAVGQDGSGAILFLHCREPMTAFDFATMLLALPLDIRDVMYVEGGPQAGMLLHTEDSMRIWMGRHRADFWSTGNADAPLPNILGVTRRPDMQDPPVFVHLQQPAHLQP